MKYNIATISIEDITKFNLKFMSEYQIKKTSIQNSLYYDLFLINYNDEFIACSSNTNLLGLIYDIKTNRCYMNYETILQKSCQCCIIYYNAILTDISLKELIQRYQYQGECKMNKNIKLEEIKEEITSYSDDDLYNINSWGADLSFRELITMYSEGDLLKPQLQRKYVWTRPEASRFIDSILLGLPVPSIFLAKEENETMLIVDGYQRIMTIYDYVKGKFSDDGKVFKLSNTETINEKWRGKAFIELSAEEQRKIKMTTIHAIIFEQKYPHNDTGMYQIFERINTGGKSLKPQEIRNCVYEGEFNSLIVKLNKDLTWRSILRQREEDPRMSDMELILRFFAISFIKNEEEINQKQINLVKYLNNFMGRHRHLSNDMKQYEDVFNETMKFLSEKLGDLAFRTIKKDGKSSNKIHPAIFDAVSAATVFVLNKNISLLDIDISNKYKILLENSEFLDAISARTTNISNIKKRIELASSVLYGVTYEW